VSGLRVPVAHPKPDIQGFLRAMRGEVEPRRPPLVEYLVDNSVMRPILKNMLNRTWVDTSDYTEFIGGQMNLTGENRGLIDAWLDNQIAFWYHMGYDFVRVEVSLPLPAVSHLAGDTARGNEGHSRAWQGLGSGPIGSREDFERYPWPVIGDDNFYIHRYICSHLPDGFGFITCHAGGVYEHVSRLMGYESLCMKLHDDPDLVRAVADRVGGLLLEYNRRLLQLDRLSAVFQGEDMGFNTQTLLPPEALRTYILPWHGKYARMAHARGLPYYLHSCGCLDELMEDLIDTVCIDGKHSYMDTVISAAEAKRRWGNRIAILGGVDLHKLVTLPEGELRAYIRSVIDACAPGGRFAVGAGNSIPSYVPLDSYLTLLDESLR
jgi:uroporphyrinogen decarboxylase